MDYTVLPANYTIPASMVILGMLMSLDRDDSPNCESSDLVSELVSFTLALTGPHGKALTVCAFIFTTATSQ